MLYYFKEKNIRYYTLRLYRHSQRHTCPGATSTPVSTDLLGLGTWNTCSIGIILTIFGISCLFKAPLFSECLFFFLLVSLYLCLSLLVSSCLCLFHLFSSCIFLYLLISSYIFLSLFSFIVSSWSTK